MLVHLSVDQTSASFSFARRDKEIRLVSRTEENLERRLNFLALLSSASFAFGDISRRDGSAVSSIIDRA